MCVNRLSDGAGDVFLARAPDYLVPKDQLAFQYQLMLQDGLYIISSYNCFLAKAIEGSSFPDITDSVHEISKAASIVFISNLIALSVVVSLSPKAFRATHSGIWIVIDHLFRWSVCGFVHCDNNLWLNMLMRKSEKGR